MDTANDLKVFHELKSLTFTKSILIFFLLKFYDLNRKCSKHLLFRSKLRTILLGAKINEGPVLSEHECPFGQWMQIFLLKACADFPELAELERLHTDMHREARMVVKRYHAGNEDNAAGLAKIEKLAERIVILLDLLEAKCQEPNG